MSVKPLTAGSFALYPPQARALGEAHLSLLQRLPVAFAATLLRELIGYDWHFPAERAELNLQLHMLGSMSAGELGATMAAFARIPLSPDLTDLPWATQPAEFVERLTAFLWTAHAIDAFRDAALAYGDLLHRQQPEDPRNSGRLCIVVVGRGAGNVTRPLFAKLRPHGTYFNQVDNTAGLNHLLSAVSTRTEASPDPYAHWYVDGGSPASFPTPATGVVTGVSYDGLAPLRASILHQMQGVRSTRNVGPEELRTALAAMRPADLGQASPTEETLRRFELSLLTEGAGTQIFSTTFVQWAGREILRRARPQTLLLRYAPRQIDRPMNNLLFTEPTPAAEDPQGSLADAEMGAYYTWINLSRLPGAGSARFLAWFEEGRQAVAIAPGMAKGAVSTQPCTLPQILAWTA